MPGTIRMQAILSTQLGADRGRDVEEIAGLIADTCIFSKAGIRIAEEVGRESFAQFDLAMLEKLVSRLKNDQKLAATCGEQ